ncbi:MAG: hypothetical protein J5881_04280 [Clostridia bacterium]|nr:hypothetical protein [Clostridia bacterium]
MWNNSYNIKKIKDVKSEFTHLGKDKQSALYKCTIYYIDNNNKDKSFDVAVMVSKDSEGGILGTYDSYTGSTRFTRWVGLYDEGNTENSQLEPDNYAEEVMKDDVKILFSNKLKKDNQNNIEKLLDYMVEDVTILSDKDKKEIVENDYTEYFKNTDTLAEVTYSVKPKDINNTGWISGNGEISGEWIKNKTAYICVRNGEIVFSGTGW